MIHQVAIAGGADTFITPVQDSGTAATPGCAFFQYTFPVPVTVNNQANTYFAYVVTDAARAGEITFRSFRTFYKLQVSPPPGTATFGDVPTTHLFYQYIEALAAAGITSGCGGGNFCPDAALTRGQMAVFLAKALGLHWPN